MSTYRISNSDDARALALLLGVDFPEGRGRFPLTRLKAAALAEGHSVDDSQYDSASTGTQSCYEVSGFAKVGKGKNDVRAFVSAIICASDIREYARHTRGRLSHSAVAEAAAQIEHWIDFELTDLKEIGALHVSG